MCHHHCFHFNATTTRSIGDSWHSWVVLNVTRTSSRGTLLVLISNDTKRPAGPRQHRRTRWISGWGRFSGAAGRHHGRDQWSRLGWLHSLWHWDSNCGDTHFCLPTTQDNKFSFLILKLHMHVFLLENWNKKVWVCHILRAFGTADIGDLPDN